jgi:hypothetical protein
VVHPAERSGDLVKVVVAVVVTTTAVDHRGLVPDLGVEKNQVAITTIIVGRDRDHEVQEKRGKGPSLAPGLLLVDDPAVLPVLILIVVVVVVGTE